jgi:hypothetical protein
MSESDPSFPRTATEPADPIGPPGNVVLAGLVLDAAAGDCPKLGPGLAIAMAEAEALSEGPAAVVGPLRNGRFPSARRTTTIATTTRAMPPTTRPDGRLPPEPVTTAEVCTGGGIGPGSITTRYVTGEPADP